MIFVYCHNSINVRLKTNKKKKKQQNFTRLHGLRKHDPEQSPMYGNLKE